MKSMKKMWLFGGLMIVAGFTAAESPSFDGDVVMKWLQHDGDDRLMQLQQPFAFVDRRGKRWHVPQDAIVDGASIPRFFWRTIGPPFVGDYRFASVVHDYFCDERTETWQSTHRMFYEASLLGGGG